MRVVIKVGTQSILATDGTPNEPVMLHLVEQIAALQQSGHHVVLVTSGAVGSGRKVAQQILGAEFGNTLGEKQVLASLGQHELMHVYAAMLKTHHILASQLLLTKQDFQTRHHYLNIARLLRVILAHKNIMPIINENDSVAIEELMFTDNDELAGLIAAQINADKLIILSHVAGVYSTDPQDAEAECLSVIDPAHGWPLISAVQSGQGRGGMVSKLGTARKMSLLGITTHIASIYEPAIIQRLLAGERIGTVILPSKKKSNIKRWMAYTNEKKAGAIIINEGLQAILQEGKRVISLLPVGIIGCSGDFKKSDLVDIVSVQGQTIGVGIAKYDAAKLMGFLGLKGKPEFIHHDYLHLF